MGCGSSSLSDGGGADGRRSEEAMRPGRRRDGGQADSVDSEVAQWKDVGFAASSVRAALAKLEGDAQTASSAFAPLVRVVPGKQHVGLERVALGRRLVAGSTKQGGLFVVLDAGQMASYSAAMMATVFTTIEAGGLSWIDVLDDAMLVQVMRLLPLDAFCAMASTCCRLNLLSFDAEVGDESWSILTLANLRIRDSSLLRMASHEVRCIVSLDLSGCSLVTDAGVAAILEANPTLRDISIANCTSLTVATLEAIALASSHLVRANLSVSKIQVPDSGLNDVLKLLATHASQLVQLNIHGWVIETSGLVALISSCSHLVDLTCSLRNIVSVPAVDDAGFITFVQGAERLQSLSLSHTPYLKAQSLTAILAHMPELAELRLAYGKFQHVKIQPAISRSLTTVAFDNVAIDDVGVSVFLRGCPSIQQLEFRFCAYISDVFLESPLPYALQSLVLVSCPISDRGVRCILNQQPQLAQLVTVDLSHTNITEESIPLLLKLGKHVPYIGVADCATLPSSVIIDFYIKRQAQIHKYASQFQRLVTDAVPSSRFHLPSGQLRPSASITSLTDNASARDLSRTSARDLSRTSARDLSRTSARDLSSRTSARDLTLRKR